MISQANCTATTPMGATLVSDEGLPGGGATFRVWAPRARAVYLDGVFGGVSRSGQTPDLLLAKDANGYWSGFLPEAADGDTYIYLRRRRGLERHQTRPLRARAGQRSGCALSHLQRNPPLGQGLSVARRRLPHAGLRRHGGLPAPHRNVRTGRAEPRFHLPRCAGEDPISGRAGRQRRPAAAPLRDGGLALAGLSRPRLPGRWTSTRRSSTTRSTTRPISSILWRRSTGCWPPRDSRP